MSSKTKKSNKIIYDKKGNANKINKSELNKTLKQIEKKLLTTLPHYIDNTDKKEVKSVTNYLMVDIKKVVTENMENNQRIVYRKFSKRVENEIVKFVQDISFVNHVCYANRSKHNYMILFVVYDHQDYFRASEIIESAVFKAEQSFNNLYIDLRVLSISEVEEDPNELRGTTVLFTRNS